MPFQIIRNDITKVKADAIVNTANPHPTYASGSDLAIYEAAGINDLLQERKKIGDIAVGQAFVTPAFALHAKYIIHTVGPQWIDGNHGEREAVRFCYENSLLRAKENNCKSVAFPLIATGIYGFPKDEALQIAISVISKFLLHEEMTIYMVVYDRKAFELSNKLFHDVDEYIDENYVATQNLNEYPSIYGMDENRRRRLDCYTEESDYPIEEINSPKMIHNVSKVIPIRALSEDVGGSSLLRSLDDVMNQLGETFQKRLLRLVDEKGMSDVDVYKKANLDRKLFSKIRCNVDYTPKKKTAVALAIALKLNLDETKDLLGRAEMALSPSNKFDLIIEYFIQNNVYDIYAINLLLFEHNQQLLGE